MTHVKTIKVSIRPHDGQNISLVSPSRQGCPRQSEAQGEVDRAPPHRRTRRGGRGGCRPPRPHSFGQKLRNIRAMFGYLHQAIYSFQAKISIYYI